jgi:hypothetical protein
MISEAALSIATSVAAAPVAIVVKAISFELFATRAHNCPENVRFSAWM